VAQLRHIPHWHSAVDWLPEPSEVHHTRRATAHSAHPVLVPEQIRPAAYHLRPDSTSTLAVQFMDTPTSVVSQTPELGSGVGDASRTRAHSLQLVPLQHQGRRAAHIMSSDGTSLPVAQLRHIPHSAVDWLPEPSEVHYTRRAAAHSANPVLVPVQIRPAAYHLRPDSTSTLAVQLMDTPTPAVSQTPELGSGVGDASSTAAVDGFLPATVTTPPSPCSSSDLAPGDEHSWSTDSQALHA